MSEATIFIDGEAGTTGLQIRERLEHRSDIRLISIDPDKRKDADERRRLLDAADVAILCLPDDAAREAVALIENPETRVIDASTAFRVAEGWTYGFAEMTPLQAGAIAGAKRVSNPGCYPQGFIATVRPLVEAGLLPADAPLTVNAISGYSGGGRKMIEDYEAAEDPAPYLPYGLALKHKHLPEMRAYGRIDHEPVFQPAVGAFAQGMVTTVPLQLWALPGDVTAKRIHEVLAERYDGEAFLSVAPFEAVDRVQALDPRSYNGTNRMRIHVFGNEARRQALLVACYDNLGKGASGAAVQNLNLMLGREPTLGLVMAA
ncbi:N-acetyl-gamma-glutamyl-phosphate reductase [Oharaeibacter diazotrophicus]|uniref:N-acetyl-gamma-glutamyl-phosphate reductase n=1 Tax=Oharaeibacter diazotrophicus TaxID=1920512 RepID=A0A4V3CVW0_9HYPH|nr:N-acetyl-gamma-glutamyl-phosphate reductase [Oharaeibacter diazotrophicus]TDP83988.1 N-acetyl-gamma-glutamyl-phosphate reductase [Oharaeibacter diazotrophicus]BBE73027.1 N-acetyl-gamma-glutamyl-phosphate reductase [Pleomorphomonas sp. SM30]GLS74815.1 N-acetyl-gamma-glutamyl-phosphate reductase [Oharaeibacter diazotrophicus]